MKNDRLQIGFQFVFGLAALAALPVRPSAAAQPVISFSAPYTRLLGAAPVKPPILFAQDSDAVAAQMETVGWYRQGAPAFAMNRGFGGWYGPWYGSGYGYGGYGYGGYGGFGFYGGAPFVGAWSHLYRPFGYAPFGYGYAPYGNFGYAPFGSYTGGYGYGGYPYALGLAYQPGATNPYYSAQFYGPWGPPYGTGLAGYAPFGPGNASFGGCCYW